MKKKKPLITLLFMMFSFAALSVFSHSHSHDHHHEKDEHDHCHHHEHDDHRHAQEHDDHHHGHHHHHHGNGHVWEGVDHAVIEKFAEEAGRPPRAPLINLSGDLLLFVFLLAGAVGGFVAGYYYRKLFASEKK